MARPRMTRDEYFIKYYNVIQELNYYVKSMRAIARDNHVGLSTVQRIRKNFTKKYRPSRALWGTFLKKVASAPHFSPLTRTFFVTI